MVVFTFFHSDLFKIAKMTRTGSILNNVIPFIKPKKGYPYEKVIIRDVLSNGKVIQTKLGKEDDRSCFPPLLILFFASKTLPAAFFKKPPKKQWSLGDNLTPESRASRQKLG